MLCAVQTDPQFVAEPDQAQDLGIAGLVFEENLCTPIDGGIGWFDFKTSSSPGPLVSDFVTHEQDFSYSTYGIHVGQDDRLTFFGPAEQVITGCFVDCRKDSRTSGAYAEFSFNPDPRRRLVIPRGVAHTFDGLSRILTRDEPVWHADTGNEAWNIDNDLISVARETPVANFPQIRANRHRLPDPAHHFMSRLSQELLENPKSYMARYHVNIAGQDQYVMLEPKAWDVNPQALQAALRLATPPGLSLRRARYAATGPESWTLVPSTESCVADVLQLPGTNGEFAGPFRYHLRTRKFYTFFSEGADIGVEVLDLRHSTDWHAQKTIRMTADPRMVVVVEPGVAYRISASVPTLVRCEHQIFVTDNEPRTDLPPFGADLLELHHGQPIPQIAVADILCPPEIVRLLARAEQPD